MASCEDRVLSFLKSMVIFEKTLCNLTYDNNDSDHVIIIYCYVLVKHETME